MEFYDNFSTPSWWNDCIQEFQFCALVDKMAYSDNVCYMRDYKNHKIYRPIDENWLNSQFFIMYEGDGISKKRLGMFKTILMSIVAKHSRDINPRHITNINNGQIENADENLSEIENYRFEEKHFHACSYVNDVNYIQSQEKLMEMETPFYDQLFEAYPEQMLLIERFFVNVLHNYMDDELILVAVGPRNSGKSTIFSFFRKMVSGQVVQVDPAEINDDVFVFESFIGKKINMCFELAICRWNYKVIRFLKTVVGRDGQQTINRKHKSRVDLDFDPFFFMFGANQLPTLPPTDTSAFFKRVKIIELVERFPSNPTFKKNLMLEADIVFSRLMRMKPAPLLDHMDLDSHIDETSKLWKKWSDPIYRWVINSLEYCDGAKYSQSQAVDDCFDWLREQGLLIADERIMKIALTRAIASIGGRKKYVSTRGVRENVYYDIKPKNDHIEEYIIEEDEEEQWYESV